MSLMVRLVEKILGIPHKHETSRLVREAADDLTANARNVTAMLKPYLKENDPFVALMTDMFNQRQMRDRNAHSEFNSRSN